MKFVNVGDRYGKLIVLEKTNTYSKSNKVLYRCFCDCGEEVLLDNSALVKPKRPSCGKCTTRTGVDLPYGQTFGKLTLVKQYRDGEKLRYLWRCDCGNNHVAPISSVMSGNTSSCGCLGREQGVAETDKRYAGKKYAKLTYKQHAWKWNGPGEGKNPLAIWTCDCGEEKEILIGSVTSGKTTSCGCNRGKGEALPKQGEKWNKLTYVSFCREDSGRNVGLFSCDCGNVIEAKVKNVRLGKKKSCGCDMSEILREKRGFTLDETKFETITDDSAYWLGFLLADGNVSHNTITINLKTGDRNHLEKFRSFMGGNQTISLKKDVRMSGYAFGSIKVAKDLAGWGIVPNKSLIAKPDNRLKDNPHFWRGVIDGDGSVHKTSVSLVGTGTVCQGFLDFASKHMLINTCVKKCKGKNLYYVRLNTGRKHSVGLMKVLYENAPTFLERKRQAALESIARVDVGLGDYVTINGVTYKSKKEASEALGVSLEIVNRFASGDMTRNKVIKPVTINGIQYKSKTEAMDKLGVSFQKLDSILGGAPIENQLNMPVTIQGVSYPSKNAAAEALGLNHYNIETYLEYGVFFKGDTNAMKVQIGGVVYESLKEARRKTKISENTMWRCVNAKENYFVGVEYEGKFFKSYTKLAEHVGCDRHDVKAKLGVDNIKVIDWEIKFL